MLLWLRELDGMKCCAAFRGGPYVYDILMDIGAYRDMHRHRRCVQLRQEYTARSGYSVPEPAISAGCGDEYCGSDGQGVSTLAAHCRTLLRTTHFRLRLRLGFCSRWISPKQSTSAACALA